MFWLEGFAGSAGGSGGGPHGAGKRAAIEESFLFGEAFLGLSEPVKALAVGRMLAAFGFDGCVHLVELEADAVEPPGQVRGSGLRRLVNGKRQAVTRRGWAVRECSGFSGGF